MCPPALRVAQFDTIEQLSSKLTEHLRDWNGQTAIIAGHFRLIYRGWPSHEFVPLIATEIEQNRFATEQERELVHLMGPFPEQTFEMALSLIAERPADRRLLILVDDKSYKRYQLPEQRVADSDALQRYYWKNALPKTFQEILTKFARVPGMQDESRLFIQNNGPYRSKTDILPPKCCQFSEKVLQKEFSQPQRRKWLLKQPGFSSDGASGQPRTLYYEEASQKLCLIDDKLGCLCSGETVELLLQLFEKEYRNILLFIPDECRNTVDAAIRATLKTFGCFEQIVAVWGKSAQSDQAMILPEATFYTDGTVHHFS